MRFDRNPFMGDVLMWKGENALMVSNLALLVLLLIFLSDCVENMAVKWLKC